VLASLDQSIDLELANFFYMYISSCGMEDAEYGVNELEALRQFGMDTSYGPCIGVTRLRRWERAAAMGLHPPPHIRDLILQHHRGDGSRSSLLPKNNNDKSQLLECLWSGKV
jgi:hypothetical protein